jgi:Protein of unknown function (DUF3105)
MTRRRRTSGVQRRERASSEALNRRIDAGRAGATLPDWRLLAIGGVLLVGVVLIVLVLILGAAPNPNAGVTLPNDGGTHVSPGVDCRDPAQQNAQTGCGTNPYSSVPAASGPHWDTTGIANWGVYSTPQPETQLLHNLEHGGIVIWYDPDALTAEQIDELDSYVESQVAQGIGGRFKFIVSPWGGRDDLGGVVAVTAWRHLLVLDAFDMDAIRGFADANYLVNAPEPNGGPAP